MIPISHEDNEDEHVHTEDYLELEGLEDLEDDYDEEDEEPGVTNSKGEQTGRWTRLEHELFVEALKIFGKVSIQSDHKNICIHIRNGRKLQEW